MSTNKFFMQFSGCVQARTILFHSLFISLPISFQYNLMFSVFHSVWSTMCINLTGQMKKSKKKTTNKIFVICFILKIDSLQLCCDEKNWWPILLCVTNNRDEKDDSRKLHYYNHHQVRAFINRGCCQDIMNNKERQKNKRIKKWIASSMKWKRAKNDLN